MSVEMILYQDEPVEPIPQSKLIGVTEAVAALNVLFLFFSIYLVLKIFKLVKFQDIPLLSSIVCITLALTFFLAYNIL